MSTSLKIVNKVVENGRAFATSVEEGLRHNGQKTLEPKYLYDAVGSQLFEDITQLDEYYLTRAEAEILDHYTKEITGFFGEEEPIIVEFGSGSSVKTRKVISTVLAEKKRLLYIPIDISESMLRESSEQLLRDFPGLSVYPIAAEYTEGLRIIGKEFHTRPKLILWLGSSIGNLLRTEAIHFLDQVRTLCMGEKDRLLVGMDLKKDTQVLLKAYNDSQGVTAQFNKNVLVRINATLDADFDPEAFEHKSVWNEAESRIEMHLVSLRDQIVHVKGLNISASFKKGESIHTENSHKYSQANIEETAERSSLSVARQWFDAKHRFSLNLFAPKTTRHVS